MDYVLLRNWPHEVSPFHAASLEIQRKLGVAERLDAAGRRGVTAEMTVQHREFFGQLPFVVAGALDADGQPWATMLFGEPGFMHASDPNHLRVAALPLDGDPLQAGFRAGAAIGLLGIEPATRRRNRLNGRIGAVDAEGLEVLVEQAFGNCPKYIHARTPRVVEAAALPQVRAAQLDERARAMIERADTLFIATAYRDGVEGRTPFHGIDVSHRGGKPGFVRADANGVLTMPDFTGNFHFRTIGNIEGEPRVGLLFPDFSNGHLLYLAAQAEVIWDGEEVRAFAGAQRLLRFQVREMVRLDSAMPLRFEDGEMSPFLENTGSWNEGRPAI